MFINKSVCLILDDTYTDICANQGEIKYKTILIDLHVELITFYVVFEVLYVKVVFVQQ